MDNQTKVDQDKMTANLAPDKKTAQDQEKERKAQAKKRAAQKKAETEVKTDNRTVRVPPPPQTKVENTLDNQPSGQALAPKGKVNLVQFKAMASTRPDVDELFQELLKENRLEKPRAIAIEMRRLGHTITYEAKES